MVYNQWLCGKNASSMMRASVEVEEIRSRGSSWCVYGVDGWLRDGVKMAGLDSFSVRCFFIPHQQQHHTCTSMYVLENT